MLAAALCDFALPVARVLGWTYVWLPNGNATLRGVAAAPRPSPPAPVGTCKTLTQPV